MDLDWWSLVWHGVESSMHIWGVAIGANPWPFVGVVVLGALGILLRPGRRSRRF